MESQYVKEKRILYGDFPEPSEFLLADNLGERNKQLITSIQVSDNLHAHKYELQREKILIRSSEESHFWGNSWARSQWDRHCSSSWVILQQARKKNFRRTFEDCAITGDTIRFDAHPSLTHTMSEQIKNN